MSYSHAHTSKALRPSLVGGYALPPIWQGRLDGMREALLAGVAATIPLPFSIALNGGLTIALAVLVALPAVFLRAERERAWRGIGQAGIWVCLAGLGFFITVLLGQVIAPAGAAAGFGVEKRLAIMAFSLMFLIWRPRRQALGEALFWHAISVSAFMTIALVAAAVQHVRDPAHWYYFYGNSLVFPFSLHRVYTSVHVLFALAVVGLYGRGWVPRWAQVFWMGGLAMVVLLLSSRLGYGLLVILVFGQGAWAVMRGKPWRAVATVALLTGGMALAWHLPYVQQIVQGADPRRSIPPAAQVADADGVAARYYCWHAAGRVARATPWYGAGTSAVQPALEQEYALQGFTAGLIGHLNCHNQYLQARLEQGWQGLILLIAWLVSAFAAGLWARRYLLSILAVGMGLCLMTENFLDAQKGVVFFAFWLCLLAREDSKKE